MTAASQSDQPEQRLEHAACLLIGRCGVLLRGGSGSGKSQLRRYLADQCRQKGLFTALVSDDYVQLRVATAGSSAILAFAPDTTFGLQEVRGLGIGSLAKDEVAEKMARLHLVVDLVDRGEVERMPELDSMETKLLDRSISYLKVPRCDCLSASDLIFATLSTLHT